MSNQLFIGDLIVSTYADRLNNSDSWCVKGGFSKGLGHSRIVVGCDLDVSASAASSMRDGDVIPFRWHSLPLGTLLRDTPAKHPRLGAVAFLRCCV